MSPPLCQTQTRTHSSFQLDAMQRNVLLSAPLTLSNRFHRMHIFSVGYFFVHRRNANANFIINIYIVCLFDVHKSIEEREEKNGTMCRNCLVFVNALKEREKNPSKNIDLGKESENLTQHASQIIYFELHRYGVHRRKSSFNHASDGESFVRSFKMNE